MDPAGEIHGPIFPRSWRCFVTFQDLRAAVAQAVPLGGNCCASHTRLWKTEGKQVPGRSPSFQRGGLALSMIMDITGGSRAGCDTLGWFQGTALGTGGTVRRDQLIASAGLGHILAQSYHWMFQVPERKTVRDPCDPSHDCPGIL